MKSFSNLKRISLLAAVIGLMSFAVSHANAAEYKFKVKNNTKQKITKIMASPDGKKYGFFDIGAGLKAGGMMELVWDKSTDNGNCEWFFKAVFADGEESEAVEFDFCEKNLVLEFDE